MANPNQGNKGQGQQGQHGTGGQQHGNAHDQNKGTTGTMDQVKDTASGIVDKAKDIAGSVGDKAKDIAAGVRDQAAHAAEKVGQGADSAAGWVGSGMENIGHKVRDMAPGGFLGSAAEQTASALESGGRYLQEEGLTGMAEDIGNMIKRNPIPAMLVGIGIGFLLARATSRS
jgi:hypothetical protein